MSDLVVCIVAASGAGKDTIVRELLERYPDRFRKFISTTTRDKRPGEIEGEDYYFVSDQTYAQWGEQDKFLMDIEFAGTRYGTLKSEISGHGKTLLMVVVEDVALPMRELAGAKIIVIDVDEATVAQRMRDRGDSEASIDKRLSADRARRQTMPDIADAVIRNDDLETAIQDTVQAIDGFEHEQ